MASSDWSPTIIISTLSTGIQLSPITITTIIPSQLLEHKPRRMTQSNNLPAPVPGTKIPTQIFKPLELTPPKEMKGTLAESLPTVQGQATRVPPSTFLELTPPKQT
ncbi:hypothetical protein EV426DRAFT_712621 [Tirmania nivea]|nr:hypothetical protein EV426DRAFT_712621 [Tirmania nivea]